MQAPLAAFLVLPTTEDPHRRHRCSIAKFPSIRDLGGEETTPKSPPISLMTGDPGWELSPHDGSYAFCPPKQICVENTVLLEEGT